MRASETMSQPVAPPKLRGWFHLGATPAVIIASLVLFILSRNSVKFAIALYSITAILLFSVSAIYHRVPWSPAKKKLSLRSQRPKSSKTKRLGRVHKKASIEESHLNSASPMRSKTCCPTKKPAGSLTSIWKNGAQERRRSER